MTINEFIQRCIQIELTYKSAPRERLKKKLLDEFPEPERKERAARIMHEFLQFGTTHFGRWETI